MRTPLGYHRRDRLDPGGTAPTGGYRLRCSLCQQENPAGVKFCGSSTRSDASAERIGSCQHRSRELTPVRGGPTSQPPRRVRHESSEEVLHVRRPRRAPALRPDRACARAHHVDLVAAVVSLGSGQIHLLHARERRSAPPSRSRFQVIDNHARYRGGRIEDSILISCRRVGAGRAQGPVIGLAYCTVHRATSIAASSAPTRTVLDSSGGTARGCSCPGRG